MDKFEYKVRAEEIKTLIARGEYVQAADIADTIDWRRVKSVMMLCTISDLYKINRRFEDARDMLLLAYDRHPGGRTIVYSLCELSIKMEEFVPAVEYYKEFVQIAPKDTGRYILQYKLYEAQDVSLEERIAVLEELKKRDYREKWAYELAYLYHRVGLSTRCVEECDELILWFGEGKYVIKAMELKMLHQPLTPAQQKKYDSRFAPENVYEEYAEDEAYEGYEEEQQIVEASEDVPVDTVDAPVYAEPEAAADDLDIHVKTMDVSQFNTINLQKELAEGLKEVMGESRPDTDRLSEDTAAQALMDSDTETLDFPQIEEVDENSLEPEEAGKAPGDYSEVFFSETGEIDVAPEETEEVVPVQKVIYWDDFKKNSVVRDDTAQLVMDQMREEETQAAQQLEPSGEMADVIAMDLNRRTHPVESESEQIEKQITGQLSIEDILAEWEQIKKDNEEKRKEAVRQRVMEHTGSMFTEFEESVRDGLLGELEERKNEEQASLKEQTLSKTDVAVDLSNDEVEELTEIEDLSESGAFDAVDRVWENDEAAGPDGAEAWPEGETAESEGAEAWPEGETAESEGATSWPGDELAESEGATAWPGNESAESEGAEAWPEGETAESEGAEAWPEGETAVSEGATSWPGDESAELEVTTACPKNESTGVEGTTAWLADEASGREETEAWSEELTGSEEEPPESEEAVAWSEEESTAQEEAESWSEEESTAREEAESWSEEESTAREEAESWSEEESTAQEEESWSEEESTAQEAESWSEEESTAQEGAESWSEEEASAQEEAESWSEEESTAQEEAESWSEDESSESESPALRPVDEASKPEAAARSGNESSQPEGAVAHNRAGQVKAGGTAVRPKAEPAGNEKSDDDMNRGTDESQDEAHEEPYDGFTEKQKPGSNHSDKLQADINIENSSSVTAASGSMEEAVSPNEERERKAMAAQTAGPDSRQQPKRPPQVQHDKAKLRSLTREEKELYGPFIQNKAARQRLVTAIDTISMAAYTGNVIVTGDEGMDTMTLAKNMVREIQMNDSNFTGKTAKISGEALNKKDVSAILQQLKNGALIVQKASGMNRKTAENLYKGLQNENLGIVVILEDTKKAANKFLAANKELEECFNARMDLEALSNESLVAFGRKYARELEYSIDELGILALHTRIEDMQTSDHAVTVMEVKDIVDEAIRRASKKSMGHFFDVLLAKRYDDEDMIILREKDFV